jgi:hypothetical protein
MNASRSSSRSGTPIGIGSRRAGAGPIFGHNIRQLQHYLDTLIDDIDTSHGYQSVAGVLLYPRRPDDPTITEMITSIADREALMVVWHRETTWAQSPEPSQ